GEDRPQIEGDQDETNPEKEACRCTAAHWGLWLGNAIGFGIDKLLVREVVDLRGVLKGGGHEWSIRSRALMMGAMKRRTAASACCGSPVAIASMMSACACRS